MKYIRLPYKNLYTKSLIELLKSIDIDWSVFHANEIGTPYFYRHLRQFGWNENDISIIRNEKGFNNFMDICIVININKTKVFQFLDKLNNLRIFS